MAKKDLKIPNTFTRKKSIRRSTKYKVDGKRVYVNQYGEYETTRTETIGDDKIGYYNVPSFNNKTGVDYTNPQAMYDAAYKSTKGNVKKYKTKKEAVTAAKAESDAKGRKLKEMGL
jgi:hypothetical protein